MSIERNPIMSKPSFQSVHLETERTKSRNVTGQQIRDVSVVAGVTYVPHHTCGVCNAMTSYKIKDGNLYFDSSCYCTSEHYSFYHSQKSCDWEEAAEWINRQDDETIKEKIMKWFGFKKDAKVETVKVEIPKMLDLIKESMAKGDDANELYSVIMEILPIYEDVYQQLCEMIEPHVGRGHHKEEGQLPASVIDSMSILLKFWSDAKVETVKVVSK